MGTYLSTPVTDKSQESDEDLDCRPFPITWAVVDMQGWRKSMEDAHIARTKVTLQENNDGDPAAGVPVAETAKVFGIFDGHGGPEVARFCQLYLVSVLTQQAGWKQAVKTMQNPTVAVESEVEVTLSPKETNMGQALVNTFHALDRMIDDPSRREELLRLRSTKLNAGAHANVQTVDEQSNATPETTNDSTQAVTTNADEDTAVSLLDTGFDEKDDDSDKSTGHEEASKDDQDLMLDDNVEVIEESSASLVVQPPSSLTSRAAPLLVGPAAPETMTEMIQRLLNLNPSAQSGQVVLQLDDGTSASSESLTSDVKTDSTAPPEFCASIVRNGRSICNLPDHPVHAGATAVVTVMLGNQLTVANAGDSRAILCRSGEAYALTMDHKPMQDRELTRIRNAGGFVNNFGRVNGNLNLSRSIGDLKYKQVPGLSPAEQMITAEPDIVQ
ncbi:hypothetical protein MPSEU_000099400 [Mayamaea pseudoterrestris]|nr:hypothetical protein MPSEU_000099400 [Mayamaea pseudoterrestris]